MMTVRELAKLAQHIIKTYPEPYKIYGEREFTWNKIRQQNRNPLLAMNIGADGLKTGFTKEAGYGLVGSAVNNGLRLIVVGQRLQDREGTRRRSAQAARMGLPRVRVARSCSPQGETVGEAKLYGGAKGNVPLVSPTPIRLLVPRAMSEKLSAQGRLSGPGAGAGREGPADRHAQGLARRHVVLEVPLQAGEDVGGGSLHQRAFDAAASL